MHRFFSFGIFMMLCWGAYASANADEARLLRYPDINGDQIAFVFADKIWVSKTSEETPHALTETMVGISRPHFSPDGTFIAYTANVDGNYDVYVVPVAGGTPNRLTHHPARDLVLGWHPSGQSVLFASTMASQRAVYKQLFTVPAQGGLPKKLPVPYGESATFSQDGEKIIFSYLRDFQEESWKRYYGGRAPDIWSYALTTGASKQLTVHPTSDSEPMQINNQTYFLSERAESGRANIWRRDSSGNVSQVTYFTETDVRRPSTDGQNIIFEVAGQLQILETATNIQRPVRIDIPFERKNWLPQRVSVAPRITNGSLASDGNVLLEARGDIFVYDTETEIVKNLTPSSASAERFPQLSNDGKLAFISDRSGEYQVYSQALDGAGPTKALTNFEAGLQYNPFWSPDGTKVAFIDYEQIIWILDTRTGLKTRVDQGMWMFAWDLPGVKLSWSPDSRWLTYARGLENRNKAVFVYDVAAKKSHQLTSGTFSDFSPVFDASGNYILMLSSRDFSPTFGDNRIDATWTYADSVTANILPLSQTVSAPDSVGWVAPEKRTRVEIDFNDVEGRLAKLNVNSGNIRALVSVENGYVISRGGKESKIERYTFGKEEPSILQSGSRLSLVDSHADQLLTRDGDKWFVLGSDLGSEPKALKSERLTAQVNTRAEYKQMFEDAWRFARDFYYDPGLHGVNWKAEHERYGALVDHAYVDSDMTYILSELMGELEGGHVYALGSAPGPRGDATNVGLLGIDFEKSGSAYKIGKVYNSAHRRFEVRSPLDNSSLDVDEGDFILSVNGIQLTTNASPWAPFDGLVEQTVELKIADTADGANARTIKVKTLKSERKLRELAWVEENRRKVEAASGGRIGYIYVPNTSREGINELMIQYRSQFNKDALIIDERFNTGGALGDRLVELLNRPPLVWFRARNSTSYSLPELAHRGPKALLINGWSYSGGDGFPLLFKTAKVGPLIGTRTWGGLIGPGMFMPLANGGFVSVPPIRVAGNNGQWSDGNEGVKPNIEIANDPGQLAKGIDQQLDRAIVEMLQSLKDYKPVPAPEFQKAGEWNPTKRGE